MAVCPFELLDCLKAKQAVCLRVDGQGVKRLSRRHSKLASFGVDGGYAALGKFCSFAAKNGLLMVPVPRTAAISAAEIPGLTAAWPGVAKLFAAKSQEAGVAAEDTGMLKACSETTWASAGAYFGYRPRSMTCGCVVRRQVGVGALAAQIGNGTTIGRAFAADTPHRMYSLFPNKPQEFV